MIDKVVKRISSVSAVERFLAKLCARNWQKLLPNLATEHFLKRLKLEKEYFIFAVLCEFKICPFCFAKHEE